MTNISHAESSVIIHNELRDIANRDVCNETTEASEHHLGPAIASILAMLPLLSESIPSQKMKSIEVMRDECGKNGVNSSLLDNDPSVWKYE